ncbi:hypothetical protein ACFRCG_41630 [Embleya sp. NPDC056575]|uniref:hypothetical protein n=1 Tax=unclassified Embleya TaxID=2699296 RepID=UPI0036844896
MAANLIHPTRPRTVTRLADALPAWPDGYSEAPCAAEMGAVHLHRDGACCHCLGLALDAALHAGDGA